MLTSVPLAFAIVTICLLFAAALITASRDFSPGRHVSAWALSFLIAAAVHGLGIVAHLRPSWGDPLVALTCFTSISGYAMLSLGFRVRAGHPTRFVGEVWGLTTILLLVLWVHHGDGWRTAFRMLTMITDVAMLLVIVRSLRGRQATLHLARGAFLACAFCMVLIGILALRKGQDDPTVLLLLAIGAPFGVICIGIVTLLILSSDLARELRTQAWTDTLTGLLNRRGFECRVEEMKLGDADHPTVVVLADLDRFKAINDTLGHAAGDAVLRRFAKQLTAALEPGEVAARIGGEEFVLLMPNVPTEDGLARVEAIRRAVPATLQDLVGIDHITASFGVAILRRGERLADTLARADCALYRSKNEGRNRITSDLSCAA